LPVQDNPVPQDLIDDEGTGPFWLSGGLIDSVIKVGGGVAGVPGWGGTVDGGPGNNTISVTGFIVPSANTAYVSPFDGFTSTSGTVIVGSGHGRNSVFVGPDVYTALIAGGPTADTLDSEALFTTYDGGHRKRTVCAS